MAKGSSNKGSKRAKAGGGRGQASGGMTRSEAGTKGAQVSTQNSVTQSERLQGNRGGKGGKEK